MSDLMRKLRMALQGDALEMIEPADVLQLLVEFDDRLTELEGRSHPDTRPGMMG